MDSARGLEGQSLQLSGDGRTVSNIVVAAACGAVATDLEPRSADSSCSGAPGKYGVGEAFDWARRICNSGRGVTHEAVSRNCAACSGDAAGETSGRDWRGESGIPGRYRERRGRGNYFAEHYAGRICGQSCGRAGDLHAVVLSRRRTSGEDRSAAGVRQRPRPRVVPPRFPTQATGRSHAGSTNAETTEVILSVYCG